MGLGSFGLARSPSGMIEIIRSVKVYKPSKTFRHLFIHLSLGLAMPQNHHFEISKGL